MLGKPVHASEIISDGNCFFRAISFAITGSQDHHHEIRKKKTCDHMIKIERKLSIENYLQRTRMMESRGNICLGTFIKNQHLCIESKWSQLDMDEIFRTIYRCTSLYICRR